MNERHRLLWEHQCIFVPSGFSAMKRRRKLRDRKISTENWKDREIIFSHECTSRNWKFIIVTFNEYHILRDKRKQAAASLD